MSSTPPWGADDAPRSSPSFLDEIVTFQEVYVTRHTAMRLMARTGGLVEDILDEAMNDAVPDDVPPELVCDYDTAFANLVNSGHYRGGSIPQHDF